MRGLPGVEHIGGDVTGMTIVVTGPTSGIGQATAAALARRGAHVVLACRSQARGERLVQQLMTEALAAGRQPPSTEVRLLDLCSLESVRAFVVAWEDGRRPLHVLINNAGLFAMTAPRSETVNGGEAHMAVNHLSHFLLTLGLLPSLQRGAEGAGGTPRHARVVSVSSAMHYFGYNLGPLDPWLKQRGAYSAEVAYGNSKLAQILFTRELRRRLAAQGSKVVAVALHPGNVVTDVVRSLPPLVQAAYRVLLTRLLLTPDQGARASVYAASDPGAPTAVAISDGYLDADTMARAPSAAARNDATALWLWRWSAQAVQLPPELDVAEP